jgi:hypothetical protein
MSSLSHIDLAARLKWPTRFPERFTVSRIRETLVGRTILKYRAWFIAFVQATLIFSALVIA